MKKWPLIPIGGVVLLALITAATYEPVKTETTSIQTTQTGITTLEATTTTPTSTTTPKIPTLRKYHFNGTDINVQVNGTITSIGNEQLYDFNIGTKRFKVRWNTSGPIDPNHYWNWKITTCPSGFCVPGEYTEYVGTIANQSLAGVMIVDVIDWLRCASPPPLQCSVIGENDIPLTLWVGAYGVGQWTITVEELD